MKNNIDEIEISKLKNTLLKVSDNISEYAGNAYSLMALYSQTLDDSMVEFLSMGFKDISSIDSELIKKAIKRYEKTKSPLHLTEAVVLIFGMMYNHYMVEVKRYKADEGPRYISNK